MLPFPVFEEHTKNPVILGSHISTKALKNAAFLLLTAPIMQLKIVF